MRNNYDTFCSDLFFILHERRTSEEEPSKYDFFIPDTIIFKF